MQMVKQKHARAVSFRLIESMEFFVVQIYYTIIVSAQPINPLNSKTE